MTGDDTTDTMPLNEELIDKYSSDPEVIKFTVKKFIRLNPAKAKIFIRFMLQRRLKINVTDIFGNKYKGFVQYNKGKLDKSFNFKVDVIKEFLDELNGLLARLGKDLILYGEDKDELKKELIGGEFVVPVDGDTPYEAVWKLICEEGGMIKFKYDFINSDMKTAKPQNKGTLQRCSIQILSFNVKFDYPIEYVYRCQMCRTTTREVAYETASQNGKIKCPGIYNYVNASGEPKSRICNNLLSPAGEISITKDCYLYDIGYETDEGKLMSASAYGFDKYDPGYYDCVMFRIKNPKKQETFHIIDIKPIKSNPFPVPQKEDKENYLISLQKACDEYIEKQTGLKIYGLFPIKVAMLIQKAIQEFGMRLNANIQVAGDASTGKSTVLKYYGYLLNGSLNMTTNGLSVSVAGIRGTRASINLMGRDISIVKKGHLGTFHTIHIDEAAENKELVKNLKSFLLEDNYSYDKAGSDGIFHRRTAHVNVSENLDYTHLGQYRGAIRKAYKELDVKIGEEEMEQWSESWDLHQPLFTYTNPYLYKVINEKRIEYQLKSQFWIDGYDFALHERFPFYFYLIHDKPDDELYKTVRENTQRNIISENLLLIKVLRNVELNQLFEQRIKFKDSTTDAENFLTVDKILDNYGLKSDIRMRQFYYNLVKVSRIMNEREDINEQDYDILRWFLEKTNCKLDVANTVNYKIVGPPNLEKAKEVEQKIEEETKDVEEAFGNVPDDWG